jgi:hypothetical protein
MAQELGEAVLKLTTDNSGLESGVKAGKELAEGLTTAFTAATVFATKLLSAWADDQAAMVRLNASIQIMIGNYSSVTQSLIAYAEELQKTSGFSHDMIENQMAQAVVLGRTEEQVKSLATAATELANAGIMPLDMAFKQLDLTYEGNLRQLGRMFPELKDLTTEQLANGEAVRIIEARVSGMNDAMMNTVQGGIRGLHNAFADLTEEMGRVVAIFSGPAMQAFASLIEKISGFIKGTVDLRNAQIAVAEGTATEAQRVTVMTDALAKANEAFDLTVNRIKTLTGNFGENAEGLVRLRAELTQQAALIRTYIDALAEIEKKNNALIVHQKIVADTAARWKEQAEAMKEAADRLKEVGAANATYDDLIISRLRLMHDATQGVDEISNKTWNDVANGANVASKSVMDASLKYALSIKSTLQGVEKDYDDGAKAAQKAADATYKAFEDAYRKVSETVGTVMGQLSKISSQYYTNQNTELDNWYKKQIDSLGDMTNATQEQTDAKAKIDKEYASKQAEIKKKEWESNQALAIGNAITSTAEAVVRTLAAYPWPWDLIPAAIVGGLGLAQLGLIMSAPEPTFAQGGSFTVPPGYPDDSFPMRVESGEHVQVTPAGGSGSGQLLQNDIYVDGEKLFSLITRASRNKRVLISARSVIP